MILTSDSESFGTNESITFARHQLHRQRNSRTPPSNLETAASLETSFQQMYDLVSLRLFTHLSI